ncbi:hypothetical protein, partial [Klebsiella pneumoniae]
MSHRKYGLDHLGCRTARRLVSPGLALWLCSQGRQGGEYCQNVRQ